MLQTPFLGSTKYFSYVKRSRFQFLPNVHDASPRVASQALSLDTPLLMNAHIRGGWQYLNKKTGEFFHDLTDFRDALDRILENSNRPLHYEPKRWFSGHYGPERSGRRLLRWILETFS